MPAPSAPGRKALERLRVHEVLVPTGRTLVHQQILATQYRTAQAAEERKGATGPCHVEGDSGYFGEDVDPARCHADLKDDARDGELVLADLVQWRAERFQGGPDSRGILGACFDPDVQVARRPRMTMDADGIRSHDHEPGFSGG